MGLPKQHRLKSRQDFQNVYKRGRRCKGKYLMVRCLYQLPIIKLTPTDIKPTEKISTATKFGISVSQKVSKKAVMRNRLKRQVKAALRALLPQIIPGWLVVISLSPTSSGCNYYDFLRELEQLLAEAEVIDGHS